jgi:DNA polymerase/3'-5' exonuclease PolX
MSNTNTPETLAPAAQDERPRFPRQLAIEVASQIGFQLFDLCQPHPSGNPKIVACSIVGSTRRGKETVKDLELLYIPKMVEIPDPQDLLGQKITVSAVNRALDYLVESGMLAKRLSKTGSPAWGPQIRLATHVATGLPVDFFAATLDNWWNQLVCRTGGAESNTAIAKAAQAKGLKWNPFGKGFTNVKTGTLARTVRSERDVFDIVGLPYLEPHQRP